MPLIQCPDCNKQISDRAPTCPHCGAPNADTESRPSSLKQSITPETAKTGIAALLTWLLLPSVIRAILALAAIIMMGYFLVHASPP